MTALAFGFTKLVVDDLEGVARFYREVFGMKEVHRVSSDEHKYALDEVVLSLATAPNQHALLIMRYRDRPCPAAGAAWMGFSVSDIAATLVAVEKFGGVIEVAVHKNEEHRVLAAIAADPAGHLIELVQSIG